VIRSNRAGNEGFLGEVQRAVWSVNSNLPLASVETMQDIYSQSLARTSFTLVMLAIAGGWRLRWASSASTASSRTLSRSARARLEFAWRSARRGVSCGGCLCGPRCFLRGWHPIGLGAAAALMQLMKSLLFGISPLDPLTYITVPLVLAVSAALASYLPARRAAAVDPVEALRAE
jgi:hypothetical protein